MEAALECALDSKNRYTVPPAQSSRYLCRRRPLGYITPREPRPLHCALAQPYSMQSCLPTEGVWPLQEDQLSISGAVKQQTEKVERDAVLYDIRELHAAPQTVVFFLGAWNQLTGYQYKAHKALESSAMRSWTLQKNSDESELLLAVSPYNNRNLVSIRIHANGQPTLQGITMGRHR